MEEMPNGRLILPLHSRCISRGILFKFKFYKKLVQFCNEKLHTNYLSPLGILQLAQYGVENDNKKK